MLALQLLVLCGISYVGALDVYIDSPVLLLGCSGTTTMVESTTSIPTRRLKLKPQMSSQAKTSSLITEAQVDQQEFFNAARDGDLSFINAAILRLSTNGLDLNWRNKPYYGYTALHIATKNDHPDIMTILLDAGADPNVRTMAGWTPIYIAAEEKHMSALRLLLNPKYQADANVPDNSNGWTPVYNAAWKGNEAVLELLLANGGDPNKITKDGISPLLIAASYWGSAEAVRILIQAGAHVNYAHPDNGRTPLHQAAKENMEDSALVLLQNGADKNKKDNKGFTPAGFSRHWGDGSVARLIENY